MSARMKKYRSEICKVAKCEREQRKKYINTVPNELILALGDISHGLLYNKKLPIKLASRKKLKRQQNNLLKLSTRKLSYKKKRKILAQKGGQLFKDIWDGAKSLYS